MVLQSTRTGVNRHSYFGFPDANHLRTNDDIVTLKANHTFANNVDVHTIGRWANYPRDVQITEPQICSNASVSVPVGGYVAALPTSAVNSSKPCPYTFATPPSQIVVNRNQLRTKSVEGELWDQTEVTAQFKIAGVRNDLAAGVEGGQEISNPTKYSYTENNVNSVPSTNLVTPNPHDAFGGNGYIASVTHVKSKSAGVYFIDTVKFDRFIELSGGVRWDYFNTLFNLYAPPTSVPGAKLTAPVPYIDQTVRQPSYRAALVFKPNSHGSVYFDYGTSFNPSAESLSLSVATSVLPPEENETYEVGAKYSLVHERLQLEGAWFHTTKDNARETDPTNSNNIVLAGNQLVKGVQASAVGRFHGGTDLILGYAYLSKRCDVLEVLSHICWLPTGERAEADLQCVRHAQSLLASERRPRRQLCGRAHGELYRAVRPDGVWSSAEFRCRFGALRSDGDDMLPGARDGDEAGAWLLGLQRDAQAAGDRQNRTAGQCLQPAQPLLY